MKSMIGQARAVTAKYAAFSIWYGTKEASMAKATAVPAEKTEGC
jgi:hypothetical protein